MVQCAAFGCTNQSGMQGISMHKFPRVNDRPEIRSQWIQNVNREEKWTPSVHARLCSKHFTKDCYEIHFEKYLGDKFSKRAPKLKDDAVPTIFPKVDEAKRRKPSKGRPHSERRQKSKERQEVCMFYIL